MSKGGNANDQTLVKIIWLNLYFVVNLFFQMFDRYDIKERAFTYESEGKNVNHESLR